jgi:DNA topoisomerase III
MKLVIAEKPSVAKDIAAFLGAKARQDGYFEGGGYQVTWAFGHLVSLKEPDEYDPALKRWSLATLPFIPPSFELKLIEKQGVSKQFHQIKKLLESCSEVICATDAGREGELIFRYILSLASCNKPFQRLWLSSLTDEAIKTAFTKLRPGHEYDNLYAAARCRSESDWIVGLNATRSFTVKYGRGAILWSVGRVQTPILAMIVQRDDEIRSFTPQPFWELKTSYKKTLFKCKKGRFSSEEEAKKLLDSIKDLPFLIRKIDCKQEKLLPPFLYDLTDLQREMNKKKGLSASKTLEVAQSLYEKKVISYPRTDSKFLVSDMKQEVVQTLQKLSTSFPTEIAALDIKNLAFTARIINDKKVGDHYAIIPTGKVLQGLSKEEQWVFDAISLRLIAAFYPTCLKEVKTVEGEVDTTLFLAKGVQVVNPGWTALYGQEKEEEEKEEEQEMPSFIAGESGPHEPLIKQGKTEPPRHFTEATLLGAMETAGKLVEDEALKEALKQKGLGTPATRAAMIETLLKRGYIERDKKTLTATTLGRYLIAIVQDLHLKSPELTGEWEFKLKEIEQGKLDPKQFMEEIASYTKALIQGRKPALMQERSLGLCPCCSQPVIEGKRGFGCSAWKGGCSFVLWKEYKGYPIQIKQIKKLLEQRILLDPIEISQEKVILYLSDKGVLMDMPMPNFTRS